MTLAAEPHTYADYDELLEDYYERGWTDGLPVVPPTAEKVQRFLTLAGLEPDEILGSVPTRAVVVTAEHAAINAVMAGCRPEYFPAVVAAVRAHLDEMGNCHSTTGTLSGAVQTVIINGPVRNEWGVASGQGCLGPGFRPNATIGRALRLVIISTARSSERFPEARSRTQCVSMKVVKLASQTVPTCALASLNPASARGCSSMLRTDESDPSL